VHNNLHNNTPPPEAVSPARQSLTVSVKVPEKAPLHLGAIFCLKISFFIMTLPKRQK
jgi:hypothetical protein